MNREEAQKYWVSPLDALGSDCHELLSDIIAEMTKRSGDPETLAKMTKILTHVRKAAQQIDQLATTEEANLDGLYKQRPPAA